MFLFKLYVSDSKQRKLFIVRLGGVLCDGDGGGGTQSLLCMKGHPGAMQGHAPPPA